MSISFLFNCTIIIDQLSNNFSDFSTLFIVNFGSLFFLTKFPISCISRSFRNVSWELINFLLRWSKFIYIQIWCMIWILKEWFLSINSIIWWFFEIKISLIKSSFIKTWFIIIEYFRWTFKIGWISSSMSKTRWCWLSIRLSSNREFILSHIKDCDDFFSLNLWFTSNILIWWIENSFSMSFI